MEVPTVYRANLLQPETMFLLQRFPIQDKDIVYVSNAPLSEFQKILENDFLDYLAGKRVRPIRSEVINLRG